MVRQDPDSGTELEVDVQAFSVIDTNKSRETHFREIIPATSHASHQFMLNYTVSPPPENHAMVVVTIDNPVPIFSLDPLFSLISFLAAGFPRITHV